MVEPVVRVNELLPPITLRWYRDLFGERELIFSQFEPGPPRVLGTRRTARELVALLPIGNVTLDFTGIEVMSPSFAHEILNLRPAIEVTGMNEDVAISWEMAVDHSRPG